MKNLVAYITSGYPEKSFTIDLALALAQNGVDSLELGIAFSDPVADGPLIEKANQKALERGFKFQHVLDISEAISKDIDTLWMGYFNSFYQHDFSKLISHAKDLGVSGFIIPDLPFEEAKAYDSLFRANNVANISFVAPTDTKERIQTIISDAQKFIYMVAYAGITGSGVSEDLQSTIGDIREFTQTPIYVGFGVNKKTAKEKVKGADGVIVGSAFIEILLNENTSYSQKITECSELARIIKNEINS